jgi:dipeptidyl aminopeptidase/acylaminoacyl peptidase
MIGRRVVVYDLERGSYTYLTEDWSLSPSSILWSQDGRTLYVSAEHRGRVKMFEIPSNGGTDFPTPVITEYSVSAASWSRDKLLVSRTSLTEPYMVELYDIKAKYFSPVLQKWQPNPLTRKAVREFWFQGSDDQPVHGFIHLPESFQSHKKYPLAFIIHGGPHGSWLDSWSIKWNSAVFANSGPGWIVALINFSGSQGYGQEFLDAIRGGWGTKPCKHPLQAC